MPKNFVNYAAYYDTLYREKDYARESQYLIDLFTSFSSRPVHSILDLGCGTGGHLIPLILAGYQGTGIDRSPSMLVEAARKGSRYQIAPTFIEGDVRTVRQGHTFDAVISMFAVMSYQTRNEDLASSFRTARAHLETGGLFIFDAWYGPAVLHEQPSDRIREIELDTDRLIRFASPELDLIQHTVQVNYTLLRIRGNQVLEEVKEEHPMRYLFAQEVAFFGQAANFEILDLHTFMEPGKLPTEKDWNVTWVLRAI